MKVEIKKELFKNIDFDKKQLLIHKVNGNIIITDGTHSGNSFSGMSINENFESKYSNVYRTDWIKNNFKLLSSPIILSND